MLRYDIFNGILKQNLYIAAQARVFHSSQHCFAVLFFPWMWWCVSQESLILLCCGVLFVCCGQQLSGLHRNLVLLRCLQPSFPHVWVWSFYLNLGHGQLFQRKNSGAKRMPLTETVDCIRGLVLCAQYIGSHVRRVRSRSPYLPNIKNEGRVSCLSLMRNLEEMYLCGSLF
jgi:hypothetical protein